MKGLSVRSILLMLLQAACVDRIDIETEPMSEYPLAVEGFISDQPGPYKIEISRSFDMESKLSIKTPISARRVVLSDDEGNNELLTETSQGIYFTNPDGIQGVVGRAYSLHIEFLDGRVYESRPDTLFPAGMMKNVYHRFKSEKDNTGATTYGFDIFFDSEASNQNRLMWKFTGTYQVETNPELYAESCGEAQCPKPRACSSYVVVNGQLEYVKPCECCTCWIQFFNDSPVVSDNQFVQGGQFEGIRAGYVPVNQWTFMHKVHAEVSQMSLSAQAFRFWKAIQAQKQATNSLFQPITGRIASNFEQTSGATGQIEGLFYATAIVKKAIFINRNDVPSEGVIPEQNLPFKESCLRLFPYATAVEPDYWK